MERFFTEAFEKITDKEEAYRTLIMNMRSEEALRIRNEYYRGKLKSMGKNVVIAAGAKLVNPQYISLGDNVTICEDVTVIARGKGGITIGSGTTLTERVYLDTEGEDGYISIGKDVYIGTGTTLFGHAGLEIGDHCLLAQRINITPYSHIFEDPGCLIGSQGGHTDKVIIGKDSYIGMGVCVLYSADIGEGAVVGAGSVVVKPIPPYGVAVGNPARVIRKRGEKKAEQIENKS